jgi:hypothetical protein
MLGLMGTLIPLSPALAALAEGDTQQLADKLRIAFSVTVIGLLIGGLAFVVSIVRDRIYSQDISDLEYLLELLEGGPKRLRAGRRKDTEGRWVDELASGTAEAPLDEGASKDERGAADEGAASQEAPPSDEAASSGADEEHDAGVTLEPAPRADTLPESALVTPSNAERPSLDQLASFEDGTIPWNRDDDPFASLGPAEEPGERG